MVQRSRHISLILVCALAVAWWGILNGQARRPVPTLYVGKSNSTDAVGQVQRSSLSVVGQTVPAVAGGAGAVPIRISLQTDVDDTLAKSIQLDSLEIEMLRIEISKAEETVNATSFWQRILPQIHLSASFGMHDLMFIDPTSYTPYILPRDAYRLTMSLPLNEVLTSSRHTQAILDLQKLRAEYSLRMIQRINSRKALEEQLLAIQDQSASLENESRLIRELLRFNEMRFQQGKIEFDALMRTRLELSAAMRSLLQLHHQEALIRLKLSY